VFRISKARYLVSSEIQMSKFIHVYVTSEYEIINVAVIIFQEGGGMEP